MDFFRKGWERFKANIVEEFTLGLVKSSKNKKNKSHDYSVKEILVGIPLVIIIFASFVQLFDSVGSAITFATLTCGVGIGYMIAGIPGVAIVAAIIELVKLSNENALTFKNFIVRTIKGTAIFSGSIIAVLIFAYIVIALLGFGI